MSAPVQNHSLKAPLRAQKMFNQEMSDARLGDMVELCRIDPKSMDKSSSYQMEECREGAIIVRTYQKNDKRYSQCYLNGLEESDIAVEGRDVSVHPYGAGSVYVFDDMILDTMTRAVVGRIPREHLQQWIATWRRHQAGFTVLVNGKLFLNGQKFLGNIAEESVYRNFGMDTYVQLGAKGVLYEFVTMLSAGSPDTHIRLDVESLESVSEWRPWMNREVMVRTDDGRYGYSRFRGEKYAKSNQPRSWLYLDDGEPRFVPGSLWETHDLGIVYETWEDDEGRMRFFYRDRFGFRRSLTLGDLGYAVGLRGLLVSQLQNGIDGKELAVYFHALSNPLEVRH